MAGILTGVSAADATLDLDAYLRRIGYAGGLAPTARTLADLHLAHATQVPFENLDILLGRPIRLDLESLQAKLVRDRRGGYCFEQNILFAAVLRRLGFRVTSLAARVRLGTQRLLPRTHMVLRIDLDGVAYLADVGFGVDGPLLPVPLVEGEPCRQFARELRPARERDAWVLQARLGDGWEDLYAFTLEPHELVDYEVANYYVSTHPDSRFTQTLTVQRSTPEVRYRLVNGELTEERGGVQTTRSVGGGDELLAVLADMFGLVFPTGTRFR